MSKSVQCEMQHMRLANPVVRHGAGASDLLLTAFSRTPSFNIDETLPCLKLGALVLFCLLFLFPTSLCGVIVLDSARTHAQLAHTQLTHNLLTHNLHTHNLLTTTCSHTTCSHTTYSHTTYSHTTYSHTTFSHTQLTHTQLTHIQLAHTQHTHSGRRGTCVAGVHLETCSCTLRGRRGTLRHPPSFHVAGVARMALGWLWWHARFPRARVVAAAAAFCVAGVALGDIHLRFTWQAWHLVTSTFVSRGRRGTRLSHFAWQAWHVWHWASSGGALGSHVPEWSPRLFAWQAWHLETFIFVSRGRRGTWWHPPSFHVAGVVLDFLTLRGRRGTYGTGLALVARSVPTCPSGRRGFLRGRRGTWRHSSSFHVAGVVLGDIHLRFTWQAWHSTYSHTTCSHTAYSHATYSRTTCTYNLLTQASHLAIWIVTLRGRRGTYGTGLALVARSVLSSRRGRRGFLRDRRGTWRHVAALCVAGVALWDIHLRFTWQAWHVWHWAGSGGALGSQQSPWSPRLFAWQAWHLAASSCTCVAGVALGDM